MATDEWFFTKTGSFREEYIVVAEQPVRILRLQQMHSDSASQIATCGLGCDKQWSNDEVATAATPIETMNGKYVLSGNQQ